uniref:Uncharacterized protein n=1 Tax=Parascaris equorum TaxID=6256 RepID=A0A914S4Z5_PAREQ
LVLFFSCPLTYGYEQCAHTKIIGVIVFFELTINFFFFQLYSNLIYNNVDIHSLLDGRNDPQRWSTSCLLSDDDQQRRSIGRYCMECDRMAPERTFLHCFRVMGRYRIRSRFLLSPYVFVDVCGAKHLSNRLMFYTLHGYTMYDYHTLCRRYELKGDGASYTERYFSPLA